MNDEWLESFWGDLLSEDAIRIREAWARIDPASRISVHAHLTRMTREEGWADVQRDSARSALRVLDLPDELIDPDRSD